MRWDCTEQRLWMSMLSFWSHTEVTQICLITVTIKALNIMPSTVAKCAGLVSVV